MAFCLLLDYHLSESTLLKMSFFLSAKSWENKIFSHTNNIKKSRLSFFYIKKFAWRSSYVKKIWEYKCAIINIGKENFSVDTPRE